MKTRVYISGSITKNPNFIEDFKEAEEELAKAGYDVASPRLLGEAMPGAKWGDYMKVSLAMLDCCNSIFMIDGWEKSKGATIEHDYAKAKGMHFITDICMKKRQARNEELERAVDELIYRFNEICKTNYRRTGSSTRNLCKDALKKYGISTLTDVIRKKAEEWKGTDMEKYLRPETLFGSKLESYVNQKGAAKRQTKQQQQLNELLDDISEEMLS